MIVAVSDQVVAL